MTGSARAGGRRQAAWPGNRREALEGLGPKCDQGPTAGERTRQGGCVCRPLLPAPGREHRQRASGKASTPGSHSGSGPPGASAKPEPLMAKRLRGDGRSLPVLAPAPTAPRRAEATPPRAGLAGFRHPRREGHRVPGCVRAGGEGTHLLPGGLPPGTPLPWGRGSRLSPSSQGGPQTGAQTLVNLGMPRMLDCG